jgi:hypothetical protein
VNKTDSAVRLTHIPTGIVVQCQNERSQHKNKSSAMKVLRARLYEHARREQEQKMAELRGEKLQIDFGSQIRSYTLHPQQRVKDHRTNLEVGNVDAVLEGDLDKFIRATLLGGGLVHHFRSSAAFGRPRAPLAALRSRRRSYGYASVATPCQRAAGTPSVRYEKQRIRVPNRRRTSETEH